MWTYISSILLLFFLDIAEGSYYCPDGTYCPYGCCSYAYGWDCCDYSVVYAWWFWFVWSLFFLLMVISCACALRRRNRMEARRRNVVVVRSYPGYGSTVTGAEVPQYPYTAQPGAQPYGGGYYNQGYGQVPQGYVHPGAYAQPPVYSAQPPAGSEQYKPPPYNPNPIPDTAQTQPPAQPPAQSQPPVAQNQNQS